VQHGHQRLVSCEGGLLLEQPLLMLRRPAHVEPLVLHVVRGAADESVPGQKEAQPLMVTFPLPRSCRGGWQVLSQVRLNPGEW
jgi:hypothetical protein